MGQIYSAPEGDGKFVLWEKNRVGEGEVWEEALRVIWIRTVAECSGEVDI